MTAGHQAPAANLVLQYVEFGQDIRWRPGERLEQLFEEQCVECARPASPTASRSTPGTRR
jgi:hypothetical protein